MNIAIVITNYKDNTKLKNAILSIAMSKIPEIVKNLIITIVDCCTDMSEIYRLIDQLKDRDSRISIKIIQLKKELGHAYKSNIGFKFVLTFNPSYIIFLDNDIEVKDDWLINMLQFMESHRDVAVAQFMLISLYDKESIDRYCNLVDNLLFGYHVLIGKRFNYLVNKLKPILCFYPDGAAFIVRTESIKKVLLDNLGIYHDFFFLYVDDLDFGWRIWLSGQKVVVNPHAIVYHLRSFKQTNINSLYIYYQVRNKMLSMIINYELQNVLKYVPLYLILMLLGAAILSIKKQYQFSTAIIKGITDLRKYIKIIIFKRKYIQKYIRKVPDKYLINNIFLPLSFSRLLNKLVKQNF